MQNKILITFYHHDKIAKKKIIDKENNIIVDQHGIIMENLNFDYDLIKTSKELFEEITDNGLIGYYYLKNE